MCETYFDWCLNAKLLNNFDKSSYLIATMNICLNFRVKWYESTDKMDEVSIDM